VFEFEGGNVGSTDDFVVGVHVSRRAVGHGVFYFYLEEVFGGTVDLVEGLETSFSHGVHFGGLKEGMRDVVVRPESLFGPRYLMRSSRLTFLL